MTVSELAVPMAIESRAHDLVRTDRGPVVAPSHVPSARIHGYQYTTHQPSGYKTTSIGMKGGCGENKASGGWQEPDPYSGLSEKTSDFGNKMMMTEGEHTGRHAVCDP